MTWALLLLIGLLMPAPANDNVADATVITSLPYSTTVDITDATEEGTDPVPTGVVGATSSTKTVWWKWTANVTGRVQVSCVETDYDTMLSVWTGAPGAFTQVAANDDQSFGTESGISPQLASELVLDAVAGTVYYFMVGRSTGSGTALVFKLWADTASGGISVVQSASAAAGSFPNYTDSQGQVFRYGHFPFYDNGGVPAGGLLLYLQNANAGTHTLSGVTLSGVTAGNTLIFIRWQRDGSGTECWMLEVAGLSQVSPRDVTFDGVGNSLGMGVYETAFAGATNHKHATTAVDQSQPGLWIALNVSNADTTGSTPAGFTALGENDAQRRVFYRVTTSPETGVDASFTSSGSVQLAAGLLSFRSAVSVSSPAAVVDNANVCCSTGSSSNPTPSAGGGQGNGATPNMFPAIGAQIECAGGGLVPTQADIVFSETWWGA